MKSISHCWIGLGDKYASTSIDKRVAIPDDSAPILQRLQIRSEHWLDTVLQFDQRFGCIVGRAQEIMAAAARMGRRWLRGRPAAEESFV